MSLAATITFSGQITQSTSDGTGPATSNISLNNIQDGQVYTVILGFIGSVNGPGTYATADNTLTGASLAFHVAAAPASESSFGSISLTIIDDGGGFDIFSLLGCLTPVDICGSGNQLAAYFRIHAANLNSQDLAPEAVPNVLPLGLLEDFDSNAPDIHGGISSYSYTQTSPVPEPSSLGLTGLAVLAVLAGGRLQRFRRS